MQHQVLVDNIKYYLAVIEFIDFTVSSSTFSAKLSPVSVCLIFSSFQKERAKDRQAVEKEIGNRSNATLLDRN